MCYNIRAGVQRQWKRFLLGFAAAFAFFCATYSSLEPAVRQAYPSERIGALDCYLVLMEGAPPASRDSDMPYQLPTVSFLLWLFLSFAVGDFAVAELTGQSENAILQFGSRAAWYRKKEWWNAVCVVAYYLLLLAAAFAAVVVCGGDPFAFCPQAHPQLEGGAAAGRAFWVAVFAVPVLASVALAQLQACLAVFAGPGISYIVMAACFVCGAYLRTPLLLANGLMLVRNGLFRPGGCATPALLGTAGAYWIAAHVVGRGLFARWPLLKKTEE